MVAANWWPSDQVQPFAHLPALKHLEISHENPGPALRKAELAGAEKGVSPVGGARGTQQDSPLPSLASWGTRLGNWSFLCPLQAVLALSDLLWLQKCPGISSCCPPLVSLAARASLSPGHHLEAEEVGRWGQMHDWARHFFALTGSANSLWVPSRIYGAGGGDTVQEPTRARCDPRAEKGGL